MVWVVLGANGFGCQVTRNWKACQGGAKIFYFETRQKPNAPCDYPRQPAFHASASSRRLPDVETIAAQGVGLYPDQRRFFPPCQTDPDKRVTNVELNKITLQTTSKSLHIPTNPITFAFAKNRRKTILCFHSLVKWVSG